MQKLHADLKEVLSAQARPPPPAPVKPGQMWSPSSLAETSARAAAAERRRRRRRRQELKRAEESMVRFTNTPRHCASQTRPTADAADPCALYKRAARRPRWRSGRARWSRPAAPSSPTSRPRATRRARPAPLRPRAVALWRLSLGAVPSLGAILPPSLSPARRCAGRGAGAEARNLTAGIQGAHGAGGAARVRSSLTAFDHTWPRLTAFDRCRRRRQVCWEDAARHAAAPPAAQTPESDPWLAGMRCCARPPKPVK